MSESSFLTRYVAYAAHMPEVPMLYNKWAAVAAVSACLGKQAWLQRGTLLVHPNFYVMLIGSPGTGKGVTCSILQSILQGAGYSAFAADRSSKEKFINDLADGFNFRNPATENFDKFLWEEDKLQPKECFILAEEFNDFIGTNCGEFVALLTKLWSYTGVYSNRLKNGTSVEIFEPCVNLFGGNTHSGFSMAFPPEIVGQGFLARLILVYGEATGRKISFPTPPSTAERDSLASQLSEIRHGKHGEYKLRDDAKELLDEINQSWNGFQDDLRFQHYGSRRFTQLLKLCLVHAASHPTPRGLYISRDDVIDANTLLCDTEDVMQKALGEFGKAKNADVNSKVMQALNETTVPLSSTTLWKLVSNDLDGIGDLAKVLQNLQAADKVQYIKDKGFLPKNKERKRDARHTKPAQS